MTRRHPGNLDLTRAREQRPVALRITGRDAFLPCKTPTSASFFNSLKFLPTNQTREEYAASLDDKHNEETKRNIVALNSGSLFGEIPYGDHSHLAPPPPPASFAMHMAAPPLDDSDVTDDSDDDDMCISAAEPRDFKLVVDYIHEHKAKHGNWPKISCFTDSFLPKEAIEVEGEYSSGEEQSGENADGEAEDGDEVMEDISPYSTPIALSNSQEEEEENCMEIGSPAPQPEPTPLRASAPASASYHETTFDEIMGESSGEEDNDNSDDGDFEDPSYARHQHQLHHQFSRANSNYDYTSVPELSSPSSSSSRSPSPFPATPKASPIRRKATTKAKPRARAKPYSTDPSARKRKSSAGFFDNATPGPSSSSPSPSSSSPSPSSSATTPSLASQYKIVNTPSGKIFQCLSCPQKTKALGDMKRHLEGLNHKPRSHFCDARQWEFGCGRGFTRADALKRHIKSAHPMAWAVWEWEMEEKEKEKKRGARKGRK